jgi:hypothetical protein
MRPGLRIEMAVDLYKNEKVSLWKAAELLGLSRMEQQKELQRAGVRSRDFFVLPTGQHYSYEMDRVFFEDLELSSTEIRCPLRWLPRPGRSGISKSLWR